MAKECFPVEQDVTDDLAFEIGDGGEDAAINQVSLELLN